jgi:HPt (histidine-containing phosphotransfer) domain-containing protein
MQSTDSFTQEVVQTVTLDAQALERLRALDPGGQTGLLGRVVQAFQASLNRLLPMVEMPAGAEVPPLDAVRMVAHTLKSSAMSVGGVRLAELCVELEAQARSGQACTATQLQAMRSEALAVSRALEQVYRSSSS